MAYGLRVKNSSGEIQIDGEYKNYALAESVTGASSSGSKSYSFTTSTNQPPLLMVRPSGAISYGLTYSSPNFTGFGVFGGSGSTFDWKLYTITQGESAETYGLRVYNSSTELVFDSGNKYLKIVTVIDASIGNTYEHSTISNPYYICTMFRTRNLVQDLGGGSFRHYIYVSAIWYVDATHVKFDWLLLSTFLAGGPATDDNTGITTRIVVCDGT